MLLTERNHHPNQGSRLCTSSIVRLGVSAIELIIVLTIIAILATVAVPGVVKALRKGAVNENVELIRQISIQAQILARSETADPSIPTDYRYGVTVTQSPGQPTKATLLKGHLPTDVWEDSSGDPIRQIKLSSIVQCWTSNNQDGSNPAPLDGNITWFYDFGSGKPLIWDASTSPAQFRACSVGTPKQLALSRDTQYLQSGQLSSFQTFQLDVPEVPPSPVATSISFRSTSGTSGHTFTIYHLGMHATQELK